MLSLLKNKVLIGILIPFILIDFFLIFLLLKNNPNNFLFKTLRKYGLIQRDFISIDPYYRFKFNEYKLSTEDVKLGIVRTIMIKGVIKSTPYFKNDIDIYVIPFEITKKNKSKIMVNLLINDISSDTLIETYKDGEIGPHKNSRILNNKEIINLLKTNDPLIVEMYFSENLHLFKKDPECSLSCKKRVDILLKYYPETKKLVENMFNFKTTINNTLNIGGIESLIIYE